MALLPDARHFLRWWHRKVFTRMRRHRSQALLKCGLVEEEQNHRRVTRSVLHSYPVPMRDEDGCSRSSIVSPTSQGNAHRSLVDEYDFVFIKMFVRRW